MATTEKIDGTTMEGPTPDQSAPAVQAPSTSWLERTLKPKTYKPRYPFVGKPLLWMTCAFGSLGDALFGYDQGMRPLTTMTGMQLLNLLHRYHGWTPSEPRVHPPLLFRARWNGGQAWRRQPIHHWHHSGLSSGIRSNWIPDRRQTGRHNREEEVCPHRRFHLLHLRLHPGLCS